MFQSQIHAGGLHPARNNNSSSSKQGSSDNFFGFLLFFFKTPKYIESLHKNNPYLFEMYAQIAVAPVSFQSILLYVAAYYF